MRMTLGKFPVVLVTLNLLCSYSRGDADVSCDLKSCILPCSFPTGNEVVIHWIQMTTGDTQVHSYYHNQDQLGHQDPRFKNRTSLFKDRIASGNASLVLTGLKIKDKGRYKCYTSTFEGNKESFIKLQVDAPVHKVDIQQEGNRISCSSERIYPEPELTWTTSPPSNMNLWNTTRVQQTEQQLYNISSSLVLSDNVTDLDFICTVKTPGNSRRATLLKPTSMTGLLTTDTTISCSASNRSLSSFSLVWKFDHHQTILNKSSSNVDYTVSEEWRQHVKSVSDSGSLTLQKLSSGQEGKYTCELSDAEETLTKNTDLRISADHPTSVGGIIGIIGGVVGTIVVLPAAAVVLLLYFKKGQRCSRDENTPNTEEVIPLQPTANGAPAKADGALPTADGAPPTADGAPPTADGAPPTAAGAPPTADRAPPTADIAPPTADGAPSTAAGAPPTADGAPPTADGAPPTPADGQ